MGGHGRFVQSKHPRPCLKHIRIAFRPVFVVEVRVVRADSEDKIQDSLPFGIKTRCTSLAQRRKVSTSLFCEVARYDRKGVVHSEHVALDQMLREIGLRQLIWIHVKVDTYVVAIGPEAE
jgi:hypothetical protein